MPGPHTGDERSGELASGDDADHERPETQAVADMEGQHRHRGPDHQKPTSTVARRGIRAVSTEGSPASTMRRV
jgi:hypothetical protein